MKDKEIKKVVKESFAKIAKEGFAKTAKEGSSSCEPVNSYHGGIDVAQNISRSVGYTEEELKAVPKGANLGLGCGNPVVFAALREAACLKIKYRRTTTVELATLFANAIP